MEAVEVVAVKEEGVWVGGGAKVGKERGVGKGKVEAEVAGVRGLRGLEASEGGRIGSGFGTEL